MAHGNENMEPYKHSKARPDPPTKRRHVVSSVQSPTRETPYLALHVPSVIKHSAHQRRKLRHNEAEHTGLRKSRLVSLSSPWANAWMTPLFAGDPSRCYRFGCGHCIGLWFANEWHLSMLHIAVESAYKGFSPRRLCLYSHITNSHTFTTPNLQVFTLSHPHIFTSS
ncbi:hypothetical protein JI435_422500 [Parastagonospora nodorum SN15]|uniref:Uncharacterized protein n=1 Tax=Phaeosphaeria nodorum (strain SN15 / ATCC MYA-4574 / FGSC 10173) TaxID=321614 RepID=A0A7U2I937_PHANO|nr:hypothetical protein JI435_422500 [Parastagonospora nodorum SN15]